MAKRKPLKASLPTSFREAMKEKTAAAEPAKPAKTVAEEAEAPKSRVWKHEGKIQTTIYVPEPVYRVLQNLALTQSTGAKKKLHDYYLEGLELVLQKYGLASSIAELIEKEK